MEPKKLINLLNYSKTLIQNGEIQFLYYDQNFMPPEKVGMAHREVVEDLERQLREEPPKSDDPEGLQKEILKHIEEEKKYGAFEDSNEWFQFIEGNLVFQRKYTYRLEIISRFDNYPSFDSTRFYGGNGQFCRNSNSSKLLKRTLPSQISNDVLIGSFEELELEDPGGAYMYEVSLTTNLPPPVLPIDAANSEVHLTKDSTGMPVYIITEFYEGKISMKFFVRLKDGLPEVFREEYYATDDTSRPEGKRHYLSAVRLYRNFERVEALNITIPKVIEAQLVDPDDHRSIERRTIAFIREMAPNLEFPVNFFDWDESELTDDHGRQRRIRHTEK